MLMLGVKGYEETFYKFTVWSNEIYYVSEEIKNLEGEN